MGVCNGKLIILWLSAPCLSRIRWMTIRCEVYYTVANVAFCFVTFLKSEENIIFLNQMCFSASGDSVFIVSHVNESLKRNERRKEKVRMI